MTTISAKSTKTKTQIAWKPPEEGWVQVQSDGSFLPLIGRAAAGGLIRDHLGRCMKAYTYNLGSCSITATELKVAAKGLRLAWNAGYKKVELKMDLTTTIAIIRNCEDEDHIHGHMASTFCELFNLNCVVNVFHVYREANCAADFLANLGFSYSFGTHLSYVCDPGLRHWPIHDVLDTSQDQIVSLMI
ncbi:unnamed protein product [Linum trigynum]|uniref:RNase H type-1 domain-containing protein n=1 Tax=Linum trigynum TaxID=586398 RepID=A0AAV2GP75_9ROSI